MKLMISSNAHHEDKTTIDAVQRVSPAVVSIVISKMMPKIKQIPVAGNFNMPQIQEVVPSEGMLPPMDGVLPPGFVIDGKEKEKIAVGGGSGFAVHSNGIILTNKHVILDGDAEYVVVTQDEKEHPAKIITRDPINDIAILKIETANMPTVKLGDSSSVQPGQTVIAIGNALGLFSNTVSKGIVSGLSRQISAAMGTGEGNEHLRGVIQTDVAINQGNSGGPLINLFGEVVGINTAVIFGAQNIGFAIPINRIKKDLDDMKKYGRIIQPFLGLKYVMLNPELKQRYSLACGLGALIVEDHLPHSKAVIPGSPADKAGIKANDVIIRINGEELHEKDDLSESIQNYKVGETVTLKVLRDGKAFEAKTVLEERK